MESKADFKGGNGDDVDSLMTDPSYEQLYVVLHTGPMDPEVKRHEGHEVLFQCGKWCYTGKADFGSMKPTPSSIPLLIPALQKQQANLRYFCNNDNIPEKSVFSGCVAFVQQAANFFAKQMVSEHTERELIKLAKIFPWVDSIGDENSASTTYFEIECDSKYLPPCMENVAIMALKRYVRGLIIISIYHCGTFYFIVQSGEGDQALLDLRFPDVTKKGEGMHLASYTLNDLPWSKMTLWHLLDEGNTVNSAGKLLSGNSGTDSEGNIRKVSLPKTLSISSKNYQQTYCVLKSAWEGAAPKINMYHDTFFRFGSWCYSGRVQLTPIIQLTDVPFVIPALRMQQSLLTFMCAVDSVPATSLFAPALDYFQSHEEILEGVVEDSIEALENLIDRLSRMGLGAAVSTWLDGDANSSFFEFKLDLSDATMKAFKAIELIASKSYHASGIITKSIFFNNTIYVSVEDGTTEQPLLDSTFPDVSGKGRGYQIFNYADAQSRQTANMRAATVSSTTNNTLSEKFVSSDYNGDGHPFWPELKKVSIWQTTSALEQEFRERAAIMAQKDGIEGNNEGISKNGQPKFTFGAGRKTEDKSAFGMESLSDSIQGSTLGASELPLPKNNDDGAESTMLSLASEGSFMPSGTAGSYPLLQEGKDWQQNTVASSIADVGTGIIKGSNTEFVQGKIYASQDVVESNNRPTSDRSQSGRTGVTGGTGDDVSVASRSTGADSGDNSHYSSCTPGGSWRSLGSIQGGSTRGGKGISGHGYVVGTSGKNKDPTRDIAGNEVIGSNYQYSDGFDISEFSRNRQHEFVRDTVAQNTADMKVSVSRNDKSLSGRISSFVNSYSKATGTELPEGTIPSSATSVSSLASAVEGPPDLTVKRGKILTLADVPPQIAEAKSETGSQLNTYSDISATKQTTATEISAYVSTMNIEENNSDITNHHPDDGNDLLEGDISPGTDGSQWDTVGRLVQDYEVKQLASSRSRQLLQSQEDTRETIQERSDSKSGSQDNRSGGGLYANADEFNAAFMNDDNEINDMASVSSMGQMSAHAYVETEKETIQQQQQHGSSMRSVGGLNTTSESENRIGKIKDIADGGGNSLELLEPSQTTAATGRTSKFPKFGGGLDFDKGSELTTESTITWGGGSGQNARPHHIPKMNEALSDRLDQIKKTMSLQPQRESPWDQKGIPIKKKASPKKSDHKAHK